MLNTQDYQPAVFRVRVKIRQNNRGIKITALPQGPTSLASHQSPQYPRVGDGPQCTASEGRRSERQSGGSKGGSVPQCKHVSGFHVSLLIQDRGAWRQSGPLHNERGVHQQGGEQQRETSCPARNWKQTSCLEIGH